MSGQFALGVLAWSLAFRSLAAADTPANDVPPTPKPAPAETNWYTNTRPAGASEAPASHSWRKFHVNRGGLFALGGVTRMDGLTFLRVDVGSPVPARRFPRLRAIVAIESRYDTDGSGAQMSSTSDLAIAPALQYDWRLPFYSTRGDFLIVAGAGLQRAQHWVRLPEEPYWPSTWESSTFYAFRLDAALQYRARSGLVLSFPLGIVSPFTTPEPPDARWAPEEPHNRFTFSLSAGYQLP